MTLQPAVLEGSAELVSTGITGVTAYKKDKLVTLDIAINTSITKTVGGTYKIGTLPNSLRPNTGKRLLGYNNGTSDLSKTPQIIYIQTNGDIEIYLFSTSLTTQPCGSISYFTE